MTEPGMEPRSRLTRRLVPPLLNLLGSALEPAGLNPWTYWASGAEPLKFFAFPISAPEPLRFCLPRFSS